MNNNVVGQACPAASNKQAMGIGMQGQTMTTIAVTSVKLLVVWGVLGAIFAKVMLEDGFGADADVTARGVQAGGVLAALLSVGCYAMILRWRRLAMEGISASITGGSTEERQDFFHTRATWVVWGVIALFLIVGAFLGTAKMRENEASKPMSIGASANEITFPPCKAAGMTASAMAIKRDQGMSREEMKSRYQPNEILDSKAWGMMVDMVYGHPELNPDAIERSFTSRC